MAAVTGANPVSCSRRAAADFGQLGDPGVVDLDVRVEFGDAFGKADCLGAAKGYGQRLLTGPPAGDFGDLSSGQGFAHVRTGSLTWSRAVSAFTALVRSVVMDFRAVTRTCRTARTPSVSAGPAQTS
jgi:hypothetical protein